MQLASRLHEEINSSDDELPQYVESVAPAPVHNSLEEALKLNASKYSQGSNQLNFYIQRSKVWKQVLSELQESPAETTKINVQFIGEPAADTGGPTREMFSLVFKQVVDSGITRGSVPDMTFMHDQQALQDHHYKVLGQLVALSLLNGGSGPHFFCPILAHYLVCTEYHPTPTELLDQLPEENCALKNKLASLLACQSEESWNEAIAKFDERFDMGINNVAIPIGRKEELVKSVVKHIMISSVAEEVFSFAEGLALFGVLDLLKQYPESAVYELIGCKTTAEEMLNVFVPSFSPKGSSKREREETIMFNFNQFLKKCARGLVTKTVIDMEALEEGVESEIAQTLEVSDVLQFTSGSRFLPAGGMKGEIIFLHAVHWGERVKANTCAITLSIPVTERYASEDPNIFMVNFRDDIFDAPGYGCV